MIYSGKTTSVKSVIAKVYRDLDIREEDSFINFLEWSAEALEKIGAFTQLESRREEVEIHNYMGALPNDIVYLTLVTYENYPILPTENVVDPIKIDPREYNIPQYAFYKDKIENAVFVRDKDYNENTRAAHDRITYKITNGMIKTGFKEGKLKIVYESMPLDFEGYPLIPDYVEFKEAIYWYINMKYSYPQWRRGEIRDGIYDDAVHNWHWYCQQAANKAMIPDLAHLENIKRSYLSLKPKTEQFKHFYNDLNSDRNNINYFY